LCNPVRNSVFIVRPAPSVPPLSLLDGMLQWSNWFSVFGAFFFFSYSCGLTVPQGFFSISPVTPPALFPEPLFFPPLKNSIYFRVPFSNFFVFIIFFTPVSWDLPPFDSLRPHLRFPHFFFFLGGDTFNPRVLVIFVFSILVTRLLLLPPPPHIVGPSPLFSSVLRPPSSGA